MSKHTVDGPPSDVERIKEESNYLRGTLETSFQDTITAGIPDDDNRLLKFHGSYLQDDRDLRLERQKQKLEPAYQFMIRVRAPGGVVTAKQWLQLDEIANEYANKTLKITTRQAIQMHGVVKWNMKQTMKSINEALLDTIAACGDVNRNVMLNPNPYESVVHREVYKWAKEISEHLTPRTRAYHEIWLDEEKIFTSEEEEQEPIYGKVYLPRKFKIGIAIPPSNDVDVFSQDLGFIAIVQNEKLLGFNVVVGGGMGMTHGDKETYPQLGKVIGFCPPEQVVDVAEKIVTIQRDYGNRSVRKYARFKYTVDRLGLSFIKEELERRLGYGLKKEKPYQFNHHGDRYGWVQGVNDTWHYTMFVQNGRVKDTEQYLIMTALREIAKVHQGEFRFTPNQNIIISNVPTVEKERIEQIIARYKLTNNEHMSQLQKSAIACVAFPTCGLAMAEAERYLPSLITKIEEIMLEASLKNEDIVIRMSGCSNSCSRAPLGEIGFIGKGPGKYNLYLGGGYTGERLNSMYKENIGEEEIINALRPIIHHYAKERLDGERFGDFVVRNEYVKEVKDGTHFHD